jgi:OOP family OmpA-OmpF porin
LLHSLIYRVEQVLLVDKNSGLLLSSVAAPGVKVKDDALVSAMLIAIHEFIHDSFHLENNDGLREIHAGEFSLWVEAGPRAVIAAAVRGNAPVEVRQTLRAAIDLIHEELGAEIQNFQGDSRPLEERCRAILEGCLQSRTRPPQAASYWRIWLCIAMLGAALAGWAGLGMWTAGKWNNAIADLRSTPGIVITQAGRRGSKYAVEGLRDPFAVPVDEVLAKNGIAARDVSMRFLPFLSLDSPVVLRRVRSALEAPNSVSMSLKQDMLKLEGIAPHEWILRARNTGSRLAMMGIRAIGIDTLRDRDLEALRSEIEGSKVLFELGSSVIAPSQLRIVEDDAAKLKRWEDAALAIGRTPRIELIGHTDASGNDLANTGLSKQRALRLERLLIEEGVPSDFFVLSGAGPTLEGAEAALRRNVQFRLWAATPGGRTY